MPSKMFASQSDFASRVVDTIVKYRGDFYYAMPSTTDSYHLSLFTLPSMVLSHPNVHVDDEELSITASKLGLFNHNGRVLDPIRVPMRRYRYGTPPEYISAVSPDGEGSNYSNCSLFYKSEGFVNMLYGRYPSVAEALEQIKKSSGKHQVAVSRFFYLKEDTIGLIRLMFGDECVLWVSPSGELNFVEKTSVNHYLSRCSKILSNITQELREYNAVRF